MTVKIVDDFNFNGKRVLVRADLNVPVENGVVKSTVRLKAIKPTIDKLLSDGAAIILMSHLGRVKTPFDPALSMKPVGAELSKILGHEIKVLNDCIGDEVLQECKNIKPGEIILLENLRYYKEEKAGDEEFGKKLAELGEFYVSDAFGTAHRPEASMIIPPKYLPCAAGYLLFKEIEHLGGLFENPQKPVLAVLGGAKVSDKLPVLENLAKHFDVFCIGGAMAYTFLAAKGVKLGSSLIEHDLVEKTREILVEWEEQGLKVLLPIDHVVAKDIKSIKSDTQISEIEIPDGWAGFDIGPKTAKIFSDAIIDAKTVLFNGPVGVFETEAFESGTKTVCEAFAKTEALTVVGGGDAVAAVEKFEVAGSINHISTGGGASLELLEGKTLPGIAALDC